MPKHKGARSRRRRRASSRRRAPELLMNSRRRRRNPFAKRRRRRNPFRASRRRRRNPALALPLGELLPLTAWSIAGGIGTRSLPEMLASSYNTGITGYAFNAGVALVGSWALGKWAGRSAGVGWLVGGFTMLVGRIISDIFGKTLVTYTDVPGLSGDPAYNFAGYDPYSFPLPTIDDTGQVLLGPGASASGAVAAAGKSVSAPAAASALALNPASGGGTMPREWAA